MTDFLPSDGISPKNEIVILDGYTDEHSALGVPPYIAPLPRYVYGSLLEQELGNDISFFTIDQVRSDSSARKTVANSGMLIIIAGAVLPGKYIRGMPISHNELQYYSRMCPFSILGKCWKQHVNTLGANWEESQDLRTG